MGSSLRPILGNVIMAELQKKILQPLIESGKLRFYMRYVDDTLLLAKEDGINYIFDKFNSFHKNLKFTMNRFEDNNLYFLDIPIDKTDTELYCKPTHTGQYCDFNCSLPWNYKTLWIKSFYYLARKIRLSTEKFKPQIDKIKLFMTWNGYSLYTRNSFIKLPGNDTRIKGIITKKMKKNYLGYI